ncbi:hypothetical protein G3480_26005 [Thiorhodococcus mannitoliphagus]|uniref:Reverse transcriptase domain-containing protein n=1 Tax=Thiorhodococcus mannitoliphagus TaxID=329406 RepID=A0A6P1E3E0_9GAMM|nr:reverse transcriptase domain-containing protein [Thiorhodococcus mannitoliphagus]NEX23683.1 hypothetical protein [Thiorhodococcus mannitoliphagus]
MRPPDIPFCRYADDGILHCKTETQAQQLREQLAERLKDCGLEMHPQKTRVEKPGSGLAIQHRSAMLGRTS